MEMWVWRLCHDRGLFSDTLDAIKFVCKDLWAACWDKQVDNLRTNHRVCDVVEALFFVFIGNLGRVCATRQLFQAYPETIELARAGRCVTKSEDREFPKELRSRSRAHLHALQYVAMSAGIIKGALARLGFQAVVVPEIATLPQCEWRLLTCPTGSDIA